MPDDDEAKNTLVFQTFVFQFSIWIVVEDSWEECLRIQVVMVLLIKLHELCCAEVGEQNLRY
jgi:hypothetical protein